MVDPKKDRGHSRLSPSSSSRWIYCPGSVPFIESLNLPPWGSAAATLGTVAHSLLEMCLKRDITPHAMLGKAISTQEGNKVFVDQHMANSVERAMEHIVPQFAIAEKYGVEDQFDIPVTGEWGTMDAWALTNEIDEWVIDVWDYKNGRHPVAAKKNTQLRLYGDGVAQHVLNTMVDVNGERDVKLRLHIIQPNAYTQLDNDIDTWETTLSENDAFLADYVKPAVAAINDGTAKRVPGNHCKGCKGAGRCPELARAAAKTARMDWAKEIDG